ncbi:MAG: hypothetical protein KIT10_14640 [Flavobacteriales bacterium]|nr:hypothetical protein [Flavobacteriales bacterium]
MQYIADGVEGAFRTAFADYLAMSADFFITGAVISTAPSGLNTQYNITAGHVCYKGEFMPVEAHGVVKTPSQVIYMTVQDDAADIAPVINVDGTTDYVMRKRHLRLRVASIYPTEFMAVTAPRKEHLDKIRLKGRVVPMGGIVPYFGAMTDFDATGLGLANSSMDGWAVCNGLNGTIDLRGMTPFGATNVPSSGAPTPYAGIAEASDPGDRVGADKKAITTNHLPAHTHELDFPSESYWSAGGGANASLGGGSGNSAQAIPTATQPNATTAEDFDARQSSAALVFIQSIV